MLRQDILRFQVFVTKHYLPKENWKIGWRLKIFSASRWTIVDLVPKRGLGIPGGHVLRSSSIIKTTNYMLALYLTSGYFQIPIREVGIQNHFILPSEVYIFKLMPTENSWILGVFQKLTEMVHTPVRNSFVHVYLGYYNCLQCSDSTL